MHGEKLQWYMPKINSGSGLFKNSEFYWPNEHFFKNSLIKKEKTKSTRIHPAALIVSSRAKIQIQVFWFQIQDSFYDTRLYRWLHRWHSPVCMFDVDS